MSLTINYIRIFRSTAYVFDKIKAKPKLVSKTWTRYLINYEKHN